MTKPIDILLPPSGSGPGILVIHPWWGLNQTIRDYGAELAREGFVVGLADVFDGKIATTVPAAEALAEGHWPIAGDVITSSFAELAAHPAVTSLRLGAVGFSFGAFHLLRYAREQSAPPASVAYYAVLNTTYPPMQTLLHFAETDEFDGDIVERDAMIAALAPNEAFIYPGTKHWFAEPDRPEYIEAAAKLAFARTVVFLRKATA